MKRTFTYSDDKSSKFWSIEINGSGFTVNYGKTGTSGQIQTKDFADDAACKKAADKLIAEKTKKGYIESGADTDSVQTESVNQPKPATPKLPAKKTTEPVVNVEKGETQKSVTLYFRSGGSDKVYQAELIAAKDGSGYIVNASWGRRGSTLQTATKTAKPLTLEKAQAIYDKLVAAKTSKGYTTDEDGSLFIDTDKANRVSGLLPQLLNVIDEDMVEKLIADPAYCAQPKHDGERRLIKDSQTGVNRKGLTIPLPDDFAETFAKNINGIADIDGEMVGDHYTTFDILTLNGTDLRNLPYSERLGILTKHITPTESFAVVETAFTAEEKRALFNRLKADNQEGIVFKLLSATYTHGRPNSGGPQLKYKFCASATVFVLSQNEGKRSVVMGLINKNGEQYEVGSVTISANYDIPETGQIIEVRYLYAYPQGSLYQPVYCGVRSDMEMADCNESQLKYKAGL